ncbi:hypothetical protein ACP4OV_011203 [Aristida adscensionis]
MPSAPPPLGEDSKGGNAAVVGRDGGGGGEGPPPLPRRLSSGAWLLVGRVVDTEEAWAQMKLAAPMVLTTMSYYGIPMVSVMFSGHRGDVSLAGATLGSSWASITGYAVLGGGLGLGGVQVNKAFKYVLPTAKVAAPSAVMLCLESWSFYLLVLIAGLLPNPTVSTSLISMCISTATIPFVITSGFSAAVSTRVSNEIGAGNVGRAKSAVWVTMKVSLLLAAGFTLMLAFGHGPWVRLFTGSAAIASEFAAITPLVMVAVLLAKGLWAGQMCGQACQVCSLLAIAVRTKWSKLVETMQQEEEANSI